MSAKREMLKVSAYVVSIFIYRLIQLSAIAAHAACVLVFPSTFLYLLIIEITISLYFASNVEYALIQVYD